MRFVFYRKRPNIKIVQFLTYFERHKNFIPKYLDNTRIDFPQTARTSRQLLEAKAPVNYFGITVPSAGNYVYK